MFCNIDILSVPNFLESANFLIPKSSGIFVVKKVQKRYNGIKVVIASKTIKYAMQDFNCLENDQYAEFF
jgi:hypothetical protein